MTAFFATNPTKDYVDAATREYAQMDDDVLWEHYMFKEFFSEWAQQIIRDELHKRGWL